MRVERDSLGEVEVPAAALWQAQTQRAVENFPISGEPMPAAVVRALARIKAARRVGERRSSASSTRTSPRPYALRRSRWPTVSTPTSSPSTCSRPAAAPRRT